MHATRRVRLAHARGEEVRALDARAARKYRAVRKDELGRDARGAERQVAQNAGGAEVRAARKRRRCRKHERAAVRRGAAAGQDLPTSETTWVM